MCIAHMYHKLQHSLGQRIGYELCLCHRRNQSFQHLLLHVLVHSGALVIRPVARMRDQYVQVLSMGSSAVYI